MYNIKLHRIVYWVCTKCFHKNVQKLSKTLWTETLKRQKVQHAKKNIQWLNGPRMIYNINSICCFVIYCVSTKCFHKKTRVQKLWKPLWAEILTRGKRYNTNEVYSMLEFLTDNIPGSDGTYRVSVEFWWQIFHQLCSSNCRSNPLLLWGRDIQKLVIDKRITEA